VVDSCGHGIEPLGSSTTELVIAEILLISQ
jgi:hypothetical protein